MKKFKFLSLVISISLVIFSCKNTVIPDSMPSGKEKPPESIPNVSPSSIPIENKLTDYLPNFANNSNPDNSPYIWQNNSIVFKDNKLFYSGINTNLNLKNFRYEIKTRQLTPLTSCPTGSPSTSLDSLKGQVCWIKVTSLIKGRDDNLYTFNIFEGGITKIRDESESTYTLDIRDNFHVEGLAADAESNMYISNKGDGVIKKISPDNKEVWAYSRHNTTGDGIFDPINIEVDNKNNIYFFDSFDLKVKKLTQNGQIISIIGGGSIVLTEIRGSKYKIPDTGIKIFVDNFDNLYLIERTNKRILKFNPGSEILSVFGNDEVQGSIKPVQESLNCPASITFDQENNAYILDLGNNSIRKVNYKTGFISIL